MITVVEEGIFSVPNAVSEISATVGKAWRSRGEAGEKAEPSSAGVMCASPWPSGKGLPRGRSAYPQLQADSQLARFLQKPPGG